MLTTTNFRPPQKRASEANNVRVLPLNFYARRFALTDKYDISDLQITAVKMHQHYFDTDGYAINTTCELLHSLSDMFTVTPNSVRPLRARTIRYYTLTGLKTRLLLARTYLWTVKNIYSCKKPKLSLSLPMVFLSFLDNLMARNLWSYAEFGFFHNQWGEKTWNGLQPFSLQKSRTLHATLLCLSANVYFVVHHTLVATYLPTSTTPHSTSNQAAWKY